MKANSDNFSRAIIDRLGGYSSRSIRVDVGSHVPQSVRLSATGLPVRPALRSAARTTFFFVLLPGVLLAHAYRAHRDLRKQFRTGILLLQGHSSVHQCPVHYLFSNYARHLGLYPVVQNRILQKILQEIMSGREFDTLFEHDATANADEIRPVLLYYTHNINRCSIVGRSQSTELHGIGRYRCDVSRLYQIQRVYAPCKHSVTCRVEKVQPNQLASRVFKQQSAGLSGAARRQRVHRQQDKRQRR